MPQLEGPTTKNIQLCTGGFGEKKEKIKSLKKKSGFPFYSSHQRDVYQRLLGVSVNKFLLILLNQLTRHA